MKSEASGGLQKDKKSWFSTQNRRVGALKLWKTDSTRDFTLRNLLGGRWDLFSHPNSAKYMFCMKFHWFSIEMSAKTNKKNLSPQIFNFSPNKKSLIKNPRLRTYYEICSVLAVRNHQKRGGEISLLLYIYLEWSLRLVSSLWGHCGVIVGSLCGHCEFFFTALFLPAPSS